MSETPKDERLAKSDAILARLMALHPKKIDLSLNRMEKLLAKLGDPQKCIPPVIHVAGTNGKGSTVATMRAIAEAAGYKVHVYSSPHLVRFNERIRVAGQLITEDDLAKTLEDCEEANGNDPITFFEVTTAAAFLAFSRVKADLCLLEVGLGGRLDATNVIDTPIASVITPVDFDHQQFLGDTLSDIAREKAGIIKKNRLVVTSAQKPDCERVILDRIRRLGANGVHAVSDWHIDRNLDSASMTYSDTNGVLELPLPTLRGDHQIKNTGLAIATLRHQTALKIPQSAYRAGIGWTRWPARMQPLRGTTLNSMLPDGAELWLDGGHNPAAALTLKNTLTGLKSPATNIRLVIGMMGTKDMDGFLQPLSRFVKELVAVDIPGEEGAADPQELAAIAAEHEIMSTTAPDVPAALRRIKQDCRGKKPPTVVICGSLYLAGHVLRLANNLPT